MVHCVTHNTICLSTSQQFIILPQKAASVSTHLIARFLAFELTGCVK